MEKIEEDKKKVLKELKKNIIKLYSEKGNFIIFAQMKGIFIDKKI